LDEIEDEEALAVFIKEIKDRFGDMPNEVHDMIELMKCRWKAQVLGIEKIQLKNNNLKFHFVSSESARPLDQSLVVKVISFVNTKKGLCQLREKAGKMILQIDKVSSIKELNTILVDILG
jgi:transcription-repair coupling factor (superfamily II helicase)